MTDPNPFGPGNPERPSLLYLFLRFLRYGFLAWGGPLSQINLMHREVVERDGWVDSQRFWKVFALYQALPGPEAHELSVYFGSLKRGRLGGLATGLGFMLPGVVLITLTAALYVALGSASWASGVAYGVQPAVVGLIAAAVLRLSLRSLTSWPLRVISLATLLLAFTNPNWNIIILLAAGGLVLVALNHVPRPRRAASALLPLILSFPALTLSGLAALAVLSLEVGLLTFGGAYTSVAFLHQGAVVDHGWITEEQFLDALGLASLVPGPFIALGTFVGYQAAGALGALLATVLIFTPSFGFTLLGHRYFERAIEYPRFNTFLLGVTASAIGLIAITGIHLAQAPLADPARLAIAMGAFLLLSQNRIPVPAAVLGGGLLGLLIRWA
jgi:chromate transporter